MTLAHRARRRSFAGIVASAAVLAFVSGPATRAGVAAQGAASSDSAIAAGLSAWIGLDAPTGIEELAHRRLLPALGAGWRVDRNRNLVRRVGSGSPRRVVACAMDVPTLTVGAITDDGFLRLHRAGTPAHPLWDQFHEAHQVRVLTTRGSVPGVVAVPNGHFARQHRGDTTVVTVDELWVDVGVGTRAAAESLGIGLLDPVTAETPAWTVDSWAVGPAAGARAGCAAVATAAAMTAAMTASRASAGETVFIIATGRAFGMTGLAAAIEAMGRVDALTILDAGSRRPGGEYGTVPTARLGAQRRALSRVWEGDSVRVVAPAVLHAGSLVESISASGWRTLLGEALQGAGRDVVPAGELTGPVVAPGLDTARVRTARRDRYEQLERQFAALADLPGVSGHEGPVRDAIRAALPTWARSLARVDSLGNLIVAAGPDRDSVAFIAHMDEVGFEVDGIARDGTVRLARRGGVVITAWEGRTALLHFDAASGAATAPAPLRGVFVPRDSARVKAPRELTAWFGHDSAALVARGVRVGQAVTSYKRGTRLAGTRFTARGSDDRTGSTALLLALQRIDPAALDRKVLFVWSTQEETGLAGAAYFGAMHGKSLRRVHSIDTFVSSETPLEKPTFAYTPLGRGAVLRVLDDGSIVPRAERERVVAIARDRGIPLQIGTTHGATDGSAIVPFGPPNVGLSWPGRYSHSPAELLDFRDVDALVRLIVETARAR